MNDLRLEIKADRLMEAVRRAPTALTKELNFAIHRIIGTIARDAREFAPKGGTSLLTNSINDVMVSPLEGVVAPSVNYGRFVEEGTDPHFPPVENIHDWVKQLGLTPRDPNDDLVDVAWKIARSIALIGTPAQPYMEPALERNRDDAERRIDAAIDRALELGASA